jgi:hypothetical protein
VTIEDEVRYDGLSVCHNVIFVALALAGGFFGPAASAEAEETSAEVEDTSVKVGETSAEEKKTSVELRFVISSPSARWSVVDERPGVDSFHSRQSLYFGPGIGVRVFPKQPHHGVIVDVQYSFDTDLDSIHVTPGSWRTDFVIARVGYGYRFIKHANEKMTWAFTPHGSFSAGAAINRTNSGRDTASAPVLGGRVGVNVDLHIERFFMGWALAYEGLAHLSGGPLNSSQFVSWTLIPVFRIGVDLGPRIQSFK